MPNSPASVETYPAPKPLPPTDAWLQAGEVKDLALEIQARVDGDITYERAEKHAAFALLATDPQQMRLLAYVAALMHAERSGSLWALAPHDRLNRVREMEAIVAAVLHAAAGYLPEDVAAMRGLMQRDYEAARFSMERSPELPEARVGRVSPRPLTDMHGDRV